MRAQVLCSCGSEAMRISLKYNQIGREMEVPFTPDYKPAFGPLEQIRIYAPHLLDH